ncbi:MAG: pre-peptidase C-terminal domain-containing protein [Candidatus Helarchaeota archaeon]|nr:pre-peptidase C-terminal domain-containing protein [Candidatus Helarchaeota archaeon]
MVYLDADCNLEGAGIDDMNEMEEEGSDSNINIVVQMDRISGYDSSNGDWTGTKRFYVTKDFSVSSISSTVVQDMGEVNMGSASTLQSFIQWAKANYPADNYALILWDHGSGVMYGNSLGGVCWDDSNSYDYLTLSEVASVLSTNFVNLVGFDACLMGATEVHYQLKDYVDVIIGSEELEPGDGYPYDDILNYLRVNPTATPQQLGQQIVIKYGNFYSSPFDDITQAAANALSTEFINSLNLFITDLNATIAAGQKSDIDTARAASQEFDEVSYIDLYDFAQKIQTYCSGPVVTSAQYLMNNISGIVIEEAHSSSRAGAHGLSIYFPRTSLDYSDTYNDTTFAQDLKWDEFLINYYNNGTSIQADDLYEENDWFDEAAAITPGYYNNLVIDGNYSVEYDFFNITLDVGNEIDIFLLFDYITNDIDLYLYDPTGTEVEFSESFDDNEYIYHNPLLSGNYTIIVSQYTPNPYVSYDLYIETLFWNDDIFEENDDFPNAAFIDNNTLYSNLICQDDDFYAFWATAGWLINITIEFDYAEGDLDLDLWDAFNISLDASHTAADHENILLSADYTGWYIIQVHDYQNNDNYSLIAKVSWVDDVYEYNNDFNTATILPGYVIYTNLTCINSDFYNISLPSSTWINISLYFDHAEGDIDLYLYNSSQFIVAFSVSFTDNEYIFYNVPAAGNYSIEVDAYEINLNYTLCINETTEIWDDIYEENDWFDEAVYLTIGAVYTNLTAIDWDIFEIYAQVGYQITITLDYNVSEGDLDLYLLDDLLNYIDWSTEIGNQDQIIFTPTITGFYYIMVFNYENNMHYNLTITQEPTPGGGGIPGFSLIFIIIGLVTAISIINKKKNKLVFLR